MNEPIWGIISVPGEGEHEVLWFAINRRNSILIFLGNDDGNFRFETRITVPEADRLFGYLIHSEKEKAFAAGDFLG